MALGGATHRIVFGDVSVASTTEVPKRQRISRNEYERDERCRPVTVTTEPPSTGPLEGVTEVKSGNGWYVKPVLLTFRNC